MAKVLCRKTNCKYCGRKSSIYQTKNNEPFYCCKLDYVVIKQPYDADGEIYDLTGGIACCQSFELKTIINEVEDER